MSPEPLGSRWEHAERIAELVYGSTLLSRLARYEHPWTRRWTYAERLDALEWLVLEEVPVEYLYNQKWLWGLVTYKPVRLINKLRELYPETDAMHGRISYDAADREGEPLSVSLFNRPLQPIGGAVVGESAMYATGTRPSADEAITAALMECVGKRHAETLRLHAEYGSSVEAAKAIGVPPASFRQRLKRARDAAADCEAA